MASAARAEPVGAVGELRLVVRLQDQAQHFLQQLVRPRRQPQRTLLGRSFLLDVGAPYRGPPITLLPERIDNRLDLAVGKQVQVPVEQAPVDPFQRQSSFAAFTNDLQYGCGISHLAYLTVPCRS